ncbi:glycosyl hydrolase [Streptomyces sp. NPDC050703]|uniref:glycoside hydrolase family 26 protein n=1 Tax=Streptomyces sp. NPDC050703 TaxID=3157218 RepID=UPI00341E7579
MAPRCTRRRERLSLIAGGIAASMVIAAAPACAAAVPRDAGPPGPPAAPGAAPTDPTAAATSAPAPPAPVATTPVAPAPLVPVPAPVPPGDAPAPPASSGPVPPWAPEPPKAPGPVGAPAFGAYLDYGTAGVERMDALSKWLGGMELRVGHTYLPGDRWSNIAGAPKFLEGWADWRRKKDDRLFVLNVPMLERNEERVGDAEVAALLRRGAAGHFDDHFRVLARRLVDLGVPETVIVLGWEMNGTTYTHRCGPDPESWKRYWNRIVTTMRSVHGQRFQFDFTPNRGRDAIPWTQCYPGDESVDIIGMDSYDQPSGMSFDEQVKEPYGLQDHIDFAAAHNKPISYPEWGLFRNGDNEEYMRGMLEWMKEKKPLYNTLTDYCPHGVWQCTTNPGAAAVYRQLLSAGIGDLAAPAGPAEPAKPSACSPTRAGQWAGRWLGNRFCVRFDLEEGADRY